MKLTPGSRLSSGGKDAYEVLGTGWETARHAWCKARKIYRNFRYPDPNLYETDAEECLDVLVRGSRLPASGPEMPDPNQERETLAALPPAPWFLEPLDLLDPPSEGTNAHGSLLICADPHAKRLSELTPLTPRSAGSVVRLLVEALTMLDAFHQAGFAATTLEPDDFLLDDTGRWFFLGTDRIKRAEASEWFRADLTQWAALADGLLRGVDFLRDGERKDPQWLFERVQRCLSDDVSSRPTSVAELWHGPGRTRGPLAALRRALGARTRGPESPESE